MNKPNVSKWFNVFKASVTKHSPEILTGVGIAGMLTTVVLAVKATPKALQQIEEAEIAKAKVNPKKPEDMDYSDCYSKELREKLTPIEVVKVTWKCYIPAAVTATASTACLIGGTRVSLRRNAALYSAYKLSETALTEYQDKVVETIGEKKEKEIREKVAEERVNNLVFHEDGIIHTGQGSTLFFEPLSKVVFRSSKNHIEKVVNDLNWKMGYGSEPFISFADFLDELKLPEYALGNELGWRTDRGLIDVSFPLAETDNGEPCFSLEYLVPPKWDFDSYY